MVIKYFNMPARTLAPSLSCSPSLFVSSCVFLILGFWFWCLCGETVFGCRPSCRVASVPKTDWCSTLGGRNGGNSGCKLPASSLLGLPHILHSLAISLSASSFPCTLLAPTLAVSAIELLPLCSSCSLKFLFFFGCIHCKQWCVYLLAKS